MSTGKSNGQLCSIYCLNRAITCTMFTLSVKLCLILSCLWLQCWYSGVRAPILWSPGKVKTLFATFPHSYYTCYLQIVGFMQTMGKVWTFEGMCLSMRVSEDSSEKWAAIVWSLLRWQKDLFVANLTLELQWCLDIWEFYWELLKAWCNTETIRQQDWMTQPIDNRDINSNSIFEAESAHFILMLSQQWGELEMIRIVVTNHRLSGDTRLQHRLPAMTLQCRLLYSTLDIDYS